MSIEEYSRRDKINLKVKGGRKNLYECEVIHEVNNLRARSCLN